MRDILLKNCYVFAPEIIPGKKDILVKDGRIKCISGKIKAKGIPVLDCRGKIAVPGFIDVHVQGAGGVDIFDGTLLAFKKISKALASSGTTSYLATTALTPDTKQEHLRAIADFLKYSNNEGAEMLGTHLEGPFINIKKKGMIRSDGIMRTSNKIMEIIEEASEGTLKMMTIAPELRGALSLIKRLKKSGVVASAGHTMASYEEAKAGIKAGISHATHLFNAMPSLHHRAPGVLGAIAEDKNVTVQVIADGIHLHPSVLRLIYKIFGADRICLITDGLSSLGLGDGEYIYHGIKYKNIKGTCYYYNGTLVGTALPLNLAAKRMMDYTGAAFEEIVSMLSTVPAKVLGKKNKGRISTGKDADIAIVDGKFNVYTVIVEGKIAFKK